MKLYLFVLSIMLSFNACDTPATTDNSKGHNFTFTPIKNVKISGESFPVKITPILEQAYQFSIHSQLRGGFVPHFQIENISLQKDNFMKVTENLNKEGLSVNLMLQATDNGLITQIKYNQPKGEPVIQEILIKTYKSGVIQQSFITDASDLNQGLLNFPQCLFPSVADVNEKAESNNDISSIGSSSVDKPIDPLISNNNCDTFTYTPIGSYTQNDVKTVKINIDTNFKKGLTFTQISNFTP